MRGSGINWEGGKLYSRREGFRQGSERLVMRRKLLLAGLLRAAGCSSKTETGYEPRHLSDSMAVQRGYYAPPFSKEQRLAEQERALEIQNRRPDLPGRP